MITTDDCSSRRRLERTSPARASTSTSNSTSTSTSTRARGGSFSRLARRLSQREKRSSDVSGGERRDQRKQTSRQRSVSLDW